MSTILHHPRSPLPAGVDASPAARPASEPVRWRCPASLVAPLVALAATTAVAAVSWAHGAPRRAAPELPADARDALLVRTVDELRHSCPPGATGVLGDHCRELATFAARFGECRAICAELVRAELAPRPTR